MGGLGSGRKADPAGRKTRVEDCIELRIDSLVRRGILELGRDPITHYGHPTSPDAPPPFAFRIEVDDAQFPKGHPFNGKLLRIIRVRPHLGSLLQENIQFVELQVSKVHGGGERTWFSCPGHLRTGAASICGRRVGVLYLPPGKKEFLCLHCWSLSYRSRQTSTSSRQGQSGFPRAESVGRPPWEGTKSSDVFPTVEAPEDTPEPLRRGLRSPEEIVAYVGTLAAIQAELRKRGVDG